MTNPLVSVIVPNYNHARYLQQRMESILSQTCQDFEVILLDDASTDGSRAVLETYRDMPRVRLLINEQNSGSPFAQWNKGVELAQGEFVWIAESDDASLPEFLEVMMRRLQQDAQVGLACCASRAMDSEGRDLGPVVPQGMWLTLLDHWPGLRHGGHWPSGDVVLDGLAAIRYHLALVNLIPNASAVVFRRSAYLAAGPADGTLRLVGDWLQWIKVLKTSRLAVVAAELNRYRTHGESARSRERLMFRGILEQLAAQKEIFAGFQVDPLRRWCAVATTANLWLGQLMSRDMPLDTGAILRVLLSIAGSNALVIPYSSALLGWAIVFRLWYSVSMTARDRE